MPPLIDSTGDIVVPPPIDSTAELREVHARRAVGALPAVALAVICALKRPIRAAWHRSLDIEHPGVVRRAAETVAMTIHRRLERLAYRLEEQRVRASSSPNATPHVTPDLLGEGARDG
jgi:hypothetical protein